MGILERFKDIMESNINALLDKCEDPEKMVDQTLRNLREDYAQVKKETAAIMADEKNAKRKLSEAEANVEKYAAASKNAVAAGNEDDARQLIEKKQEIEATIPSLRQTCEFAHKNAEKMREMTSKLENDIEALETRKDAIKAKVKVAKAQKTMNKVISGTRSSENSIASFERMEEKADRMLDEATAEAEINTGENSSHDLLNKYSEGGPGDTLVDKELEEIKAQLATES